VSTSAKPPWPGPARRRGTRDSAAARFHLGDAERLPLPEAAFDAVVCECAFCTFPDKATAAAEFARVLRVGGRVGLTDVTVAETGLPAELRTLFGWLACIADARSLGQYSQILAAAGLRTVHTETHDHALLRMTDRIEAKLGVLRMTAADRLAASIYLGFGATAPPWRNGDSGR
jgi:arsenite methyltransferase